MIKHLMFSSQQEAGTKYRVLLYELHEPDFRRNVTPISILYHLMIVYFVMM